jgi:uncharacterized protein YciI
VIKDVLMAGSTRLVRVLALALCAAGGSALQMPSAMSAPGVSTRAASATLVACRAGDAQMLAAKKAGAKAAEVAAAAAAENENEYEDDSEKQVKLVDGMVTPLDKQAELMPFPGPEVTLYDDSGSDRRPLFVSMGTFTQGQQPSAGLSEAYQAWLGDCASLASPHYLLGAQDCTEFEELGNVLSDDEISELEAREAEAEAAEAAALSEEGVEGGASSVVHDAMVPMPFPFVVGHLAAARFSNWYLAEAWHQSDPVGSAGGYEGARLHEWRRSEEEALCVPPQGETQLAYAIYCLDKHGSGATRSSTRSSHLEWLKASGRVAAAGPLFARPDDEAGGAEGEPVGSLLVVHGDELSEVANWAAADPYARAGLFESVSIAPLGTYAVEAPCP